MAVVNGTLYFTAYTNSAGRELWQSDGTESGTILVADLISGSTGAYPNELERAGSTLAFSADNGEGRELWMLLPEVERTTNSAQVTIFVNGEQVVIPPNVGVQSGGDKEAVYTETNNGKVISNIGDTVSLGEFFDIWRTNAGLAGNNSNAILNDAELMNNAEDATHTVQMFVNGQISQAYGDYILQDGDQVVLVYSDNPVVSINTNFGSIIIELFEDETPGTVANFLKYINDGDYINSFFHRSDPGFVIQGGGFKTTSPTFTSITQFTPVPTDPPIQNEPGISNLRRTVAMAKTSDPNSATSQFFVNLGSNTSLDSPSNSGGFTVFGQVLDMTAVNTIESLQVHDVRTNPTDSTPWGEVPFSSDNQLAVVQQIVGQFDITGVKFSDDNANGIQDSGEDGISGEIIYIDANNNGVFDSGETSTFTDAEGRYLLQAEPGTYMVRTNVSNGMVLTVPGSPGGYTVTSPNIGVELSGRNFGETALTPPTGVDLAPDSDTGDSNDDDLTRLNNGAGAALQFEVTGVSPGAEVRIYSDGVLIGSASASSSAVTIVTNETAVLTDGSHSITATQSAGSGETSASPALSIVIDATPPAAISTAAPDIAQVGEAYSFDADSPDEGLTGIFYSLTDAPTGMTINPASGLVSWTPTSGQAVPQLFSIDVHDGAGNTTSQVVDMTVLGVIPAFADEYTVAEDSTLTVNAASGVLANDGDETTETLTASVVDSPVHGSLSLNSDGSFTYTPDSNFFGEDSFTYVATDGVDDSNVAKATIIVTGANDPPTPLTDSYSATEDLVLTVNAAQGVLANDTDIDGDALTAAIASQAAHGTVVLAANGSFVYTPTANYNGSDSFTYTVSDGTVASNPVTVNISIAGVNDPPTSAADAYSVNEDAVLTVNVASGVLANDTDPDNPTLTATVSVQPTHGALTLNSDGSFTYSPNANFFGSDSFTYVASDGVSMSSPATVTITVNSQPDAPNAENDAASAVFNGPAVLINVLTNDTSDPDVTQTLTITSVTQSAHGGAVAISGSSVSYTPPTGFAGSDTFTYTIQDTDGLTDTAIVTVTVAEAANNSLSGFVYIDADRDGVRDSGEMGVPGAQVTLTGVDSVGNSISRTKLTNNAGGYSFIDLPAGTYQIVERQPTVLADGLDSSTVPNATVSNDSITNIVVSGGQSFSENNFGEKNILPQYSSIVWFFASSQSDDGMFRESIARAEQMGGHSSLAAAIRAGLTDYSSIDNSAPLAAGDSYSVAENQVLTVDATSGVLSNDGDADGDSLTVQLVASTTNGSLTLNSDGSFTYTPTADFSGGDSFTYKASDGQLVSNTALVTLTVNHNNVDPEAKNDAYSVDEDQVLTVNAATGVLANDVDDDGDTLASSVVSAPTHGSLTLNADGSFTYTPNANYFGADSFVYTASDGAGGSDQATVALTVNPVNDPPTAAADTYNATEDTTLAIDAAFGVLANDADIEADVLAAFLVNPPAHGTLTLNADGSFSYVPDANYNGTDSFSYRANDGGDDSQPANVTINIASVEDPPMIVLPVEFTDPQNVPSRIVGQTIDFTVTVVDPDDSDYVFLLDLEASGIPEEAAMPTIDPNTGRFLWTPNATGRFAIRVIVVDGESEADQETFLIDIVSDL